MITRRDLIDAIEKCQGQKNPNANTCIKLAAYYTILDHFCESEDYHNIKPTSEFLEIVKDKSSERVMYIMDSLMSELSEKDPKLYYSVIGKLDDL